MSVPTLIQSNTIPLQLSTDDITYKSVVCKKSYNFDFDTPVNEEETDCGKHVGLGAVGWKASFEGVLNTTPTSTTEYSAKDVLDLWLAQTLVYIKTVTGAGTGKNLYVQGSGYIVNVKVTNQVGNLIGFTFDFNGSGSPDLTV
jgi:hypothetical protein